MINKQPKITLPRKINKNKKYHVRNNHCQLDFNNNKKKKNSKYSMKKSKKVFEMFLAYDQGGKIYIKTFKQHIQLK